MQKKPFASRRINVDDFNLSYSRSALDYEWDPRAIWRVFERQNKTKQNPFPYSNQVYVKGQSSALQKGCVPSDQPQLSKVKAVVVVCYWCTGCTLGGGGCLKGETEEMCVLLQIQGLQLKKYLSFFMCLLELFMWKDEFPLKRKDKNSLVVFCCSCEEMTFSSNDTSRLPFRQLDNFVSLGVRSAAWESRDAAELCRARLPLERAKTAKMGMVFFWNHSGTSKAASVRHGTSAFKTGHLASLPISWLRFPGQGWSVLQSQL